MNGTAESVSMPSKLLVSARPPAVGREVKVFHDASCPSLESYKKMSEGSQCIREEENSGMVISKDTNESEATKCEEVSLHPISSPPAPYKWAQSLQCLLDDVKGVDLFEQFLKQEGHDTRSLSFWFACRGVKKTDPNDKQKLHKLINVLFDKKVRRINAISSQTKHEIKQKLSSNSAVDVNIFDDAQKEVETYMINTTYPNFLTSDIYLQYLESVQNEVLAGRECCTPEPTDILPTVHEDSELNFSLGKAKESWPRRRLSSFKMKSENQGSICTKSPYSLNYSSYHTKYGSYLPVSAQDSELQSLSSDAQTDDTMSQTGSSVSDFPMHTKSKQKRLLKSKYGGVLNKDKLVINNFIPRTQRPVPESQSSLATKDPAKFHAILVEKLHRIEEDLKFNEKFNRRYLAIEDPQQQLPPPQFHSLQAPVAEDNVQDILDAHISRVFQGQTPIMSPTCASPPVMKTSEEPVRVLPFAQNSQDMQGIIHQRQLVSHGVPYAARHRRDHETRSNDSGALTDWNSEDNLQYCYRPIDHANSSESVESITQRRTREQLRRYLNKKLSQADSASSCVDSGISVACEPLSYPNSTHSKVSSWLESKKGTIDSEKDHQWKNTSSTSPVLSRSSSSRKAVMYNSTRSGVLEAGSTHWPLVPSQPVAQDPSMPALPAPDTTTNLLEARRRLEDESRTKTGKLKYSSSNRVSHETAKLRNSFRASNSFDDGISHRKQSKKSLTSTSVDSSTLSMGNNDMTIIGYSYGRESVPYKSRLPGKNITLKQFKSLLNKKGNFRYFFKRISDDFGTGVVLEEVTDDFEILPLWEGKVFCVIESMDENTMNED